MKAFTQEWVSKMSEALRNDPVFQKNAVGFDSRFQFVALPDPSAGLNEERVCGMNLPQLDDEWTEKRPDGEVDVILEGKYGNLCKVMTGQVNLLASLAIRNVKLKKGSAAKLTTYIGAVNIFVETSQKIGTEV